MEDISQLLSLVNEEARKIALPDTDLGCLLESCHSTLNEQQDEIHSLEVDVGRYNAQMSDMAGHIAGNTCMMCNFLERATCYDQKTDLQKQIQSLQAKIDSLMLEYCPDEMSKEQTENWGKHQKEAK